MTKSKQLGEKAPTVLNLTSYTSTDKLTENVSQKTADSQSTISEKDLLYNPFDHRVLEHPNSIFGSFAHLLKGSLGTGILAMPCAFKNGGLLFGTIATVIVAFICTHCVHILVKSSHELCKRTKTPSLGFAETAEAAVVYGPEKFRKYARFAKIFVDSTLCVTYFTGCCVYVVLISESLKIVFEIYFPEWVDTVNIRIYMAAIILPIMAICQIRELKFLVPFSVLANIFVFISFVITLYYTFNDIPNVRERKAFSSFSELPMFFSTVIFAMEGIGVVMPLENNMKSPKYFLGCPGVLNSAMIVVTIIYAFIGFVGYLKFGENTKPSITLNLDMNQIPAQCVQLLISLAVLFTFALQFYVGIDVLWKKVLGPKISRNRHSIGQILSRMFVVSCIVSVAALVPTLGPFIGLFGAIFLSFLGIFLPAMIEIFTLYNEEKHFLCQWINWKNIFLILFCFLAMLSGGTVSILEIIKSYSK